GLEMDRIRELAAPDGEPRDRPAPVPAPDVRLAVARDKAFCFYYEDNLDLLREAGAELVPFSPLADPALPSGIHGIYLGGGYPELHAASLAENRAMRAAIREWAAAGRPLYAECGGLMVLGSELESEGGRFPMAGVFPFTSRMDRRRRALGYREARLGHDCLLGRQGIVLRGHEFHYSYVAAWTDSAGVRTNVLGEPGPALSSFLSKATLAGYTHVHFGSEPAAARAFTDCLRGKSWK
ncbi:MAG: cobyrinate a,c-diamide synthase, partial [Desulfobacteraceae bacterium]|nr:cobyrinate a,c-diamide synthase [Desulfobacteraceae bacterium]